MMFIFQVFHLHLTLNNTTSQSKSYYKINTIINTINTITTIFQYPNFQYPKVPQGTFQSTCTCTLGYRYFTCTCTLGYRYSIQSTCTCTWVLLKYLYPTLTPTLKFQIPFFYQPIRLTLLFLPKSFSQTIKSIPYRLI